MIPFNFKKSLLCAFEWNLISWEYTVRRLNNRRSVCNKKFTKLEGANPGKLSSRKIRELGLHHHSSLSLRGGKIKNKNNS
jgi:hypothetical protein